MGKGTSHVDWAVSMGIFLVFIMLTLIFLRPGTEPIYKPDTILKIIEKGLKEDCYYRIEKQLLNIDYSGSSGIWKVRIREASNNGLNLDWIVTDEIRKHTAVMNSSNDYHDIKWDVYNEYCEGDPCEGYYPEIHYDKYVLDFEINLDSNNNIFYIVHSEDFEYNTDVTESIPKRINIDMKDEPVDESDWCSNCLIDGEEYNFTYKLGVSEMSKGFSEDKINNLEPDYAILKNAWNIPQDKNFRVNVTNLTAYKEDGIAFFRGTEEPIPAGMNVFVKEWKDWILTPESELVPVEVNIRLW